MRKMIWERYGRWIPDADGGRELAKVEAFYTPNRPRGESLVPPISPTRAPNHS